ncbi:unnamed protein product [Amoebophrya sp. A120]|nr:unnamed protein product [Amoebophrya sp. A120]|eukprot:GSA120T00006637001.1
MSNIKRRRSALLSGSSGRPDPEDPRVNSNAEEPARATATTSSEQRPETLLAIEPTEALPPDVTVGAAAFSTARQPERPRARAHRQIPVREQPHGLARHDRQPAGNHELLSSTSRSTASANPDDRSGLQATGRRIR